MEKDRRKQVKFRCSEEEYEIIKGNARRCNKNISAYLLEIAMQKSIIQINYDAICNHMNEILEIKDKLYPVISIISATEQAVPKDIETIIFYLDELEKSENRLFEENLKERNRMRKVMLEELKSLHDM